LVLGAKLGDAMSKFDHLFPEFLEENLESRDPRDRRSETRQQMNLPGICESLDPPQRVPCTVVDMSGSGAQIEFASTDRIPVSFRVHVNALNVILDCRVVWRTQTRLGVEQMTRSAGYE
jgi:hypothetical protein